VLPLVVGAVLAACSNDSDDDPDATAVTTTTTIVERRSSDGRLTIGVMLPPSASLLRESLALGTNQAAQAVNAAGGSFGGTVRLVTVDEGDTVAAARDAIEDLLDDDVDAIVGPASSVIALSTLETIVSNDVLACSPTATGLALDRFPDDGLFFRTVPSDSMQAAAIAQVAEETGVQSVNVVYVDDAYGRPFADAVSAELASVSIDIAENVGFASDDDDLEDELATVLDSDPSVIILLASSTDGARFLEALSESSSVQIPTVIVNDALRSSESAQRLASLRPDVREKIRGVGPQAESGDPTAPFDPAGPFATNAFDCVTLIALAAEFAQSDLAADIAGAMSSISSGGQVCRTYEICADALDGGFLIDFNGPSGITEISASTGESARARFDVFTVGVDGNDVLDYSFPIGV
jgi:branched-chain amino acid transport system substrate-binding protein